MSCTHATVDRGVVSVDVSRSTRRLAVSLPSYLFRISVVRWLVVSRPILLTVDKRQDFALPICTADVLTTVEPWTLIPVRAIHPSASRRSNWPSSWRRGEAAPQSGPHSHRRGRDVSRHGIKFVLASTNLNGVTSSIFSDFGSRSPYHGQADEDTCGRTWRSEACPFRRLWGRGTARQS